MRIVCAGRLELGGQNALENRGCPWPLSDGMTVSPDRRQIAFTQTDGAGRDIMLVDPFR